MRVRSEGSEDMKITCSKTYVVGVVLAAVIIILQQNIVIAATDRTVSVVGTAKKPVTYGPLLDDFRFATPLNLWSVSTSTFSSSSMVPPPANAICTASYTDDPAITYGGSGYSLKLVYNVSDPGSYAGYSSQLGGANLTSLGTPPITCTAISFYVKGASTTNPEFFKIQLKNKSTNLTPYGATQYYRNTASVYITDYLDGGVTTTWQKVIIPFDNFTNLDGWTSMKEFVIVFENSQCTANGSPTNGTIYIDDITFETSAVNTVRIDHFGHKGKDDHGNDIPGANALGGNIGSGGSGGTGGTVNAFADATNYYLYKYGLRLEYNVTTGYAYTFLIFGGGQDIDPNPVTNQSGWISIPHDFSAYNYLFFRIRAKSDTENPEMMKIELADNDGSKVVYINGITTDWLPYKLPLSGFASDKHSIQKLTFTFEGGRIGDKVGTVFIDSVEFEQ